MGWGLVRRAIIYPDGLLIAFWAHRPIRRDNMASIELGRHLIRRGAHWQLLFERAETKNRGAIEVRMPASLVPCPERYLAVWRPQLAALGNQDRTTALWVSLGGTRLGPKGLAKQVTLRTMAAFGCAINPHLIRDCVATGMAISAPQDAAMIRSILGHRTIATYEQHYNQAGGIEASQRYAQTIATLRQEAKTAARRQRQR